MKSELTIDRATAREIYPDAPERIKKKLEETFGIEEFIPKDYETLISFDDCCKRQGTTEEEFNKRFLNIGLDLDTIDFERLKIINAAINAGWKPNYKDDTQKKWFPVFTVSYSGFGFSYSVYGYVRTFTPVGSRLCLQSEEQSNYSATQFPDVWKSFITNNQ